MHLKYAVLFSVEIILALPQKLTPTTLSPLLDVQPISSIEHELPIVFQSIASYLQNLYLEQIFPDIKKT